MLFAVSFQLSETRLPSLVVGEFHLFILLAAVQRSTARASIMSIDRGYIIRTTGVSAGIAPLNDAYRASNRTDCYGSKSVHFSAERLKSEDSAQVKTNT